jgi:hypothetical protein
MVVRFEGDDGEWQTWMGVPVVVVVGRSGEEEKVKKGRESPILPTVVFFFYLS